MKTQIQNHRVILYPVTEPNPAKGPIFEVSQELIDAGGPFKPMLDENDVPVGIEKDLNPPGVVKPLQTRLRAILALQPAAVRAAFLPITAGVNYALEQGDTEAALAAITATEVPAKLEPAKAALIAEFEI